MKKIIFLFVLIVVLCSFPILSIMAQDTESEKIYCTATINDSFADNKVVVVINRKTTFAKENYTIQDFGDINCIKVDNMFSLQNATESQKNNSNFRQILEITLAESNKQNVLDCVDVLEKRSDIEYVGVDYEVKMDSVSSLTSDTYIDVQWAVNKIELESAWEYYYYGNEVKVGIVDSGIDGNHPDLNGRIDVGLSRDFTTGSCISTGTPSDSYGHGTHVAGIIAAIADNNIGIAGVCSRVKLVSLRAFPALDSTLHSSNVARAISYAETASIPIINLSFSSTYDDYAMRTYLSNYSGIAVCSTGNIDANLNDRPLYPAAYSLSNIISVGNSIEDDTKHSKSGYGSTTVDLFAPGTNIASCFPVGFCQYSTTNTNHDLGTHIGDGYHILTGTSMAAPHVTGVVAMIKSRCPYMTNEQIIQVVLENVDSVLALQGKCVTGGRLNAYKALMAAINGDYD
ncbi:MAG: S8 family serine peptidase [Clostridia bacterium]|nr:S8 family serine peptidase [Clostridia bacterium]